MKEAVLNSTKHGIDHNKGFISWFKKNTLNILRLFFWSVIRKGLSLMDPKRIPLIETALAQIAFKTMKMRKDIIKGELLKSYGNLWDIRKIDSDVRESFRIYMASIVKNLFLSRLNSSNIERYIPVEGLNYLDDEIRNGKGIIILNPHFGPYFLIMPALGYRGYKINQIALHGDPPDGRDWLEQKIYDIKFNNIQGKMPVRFINIAERANVRKAIEALKKNEIVLVPSTGRDGFRWLQVRLMNRTALLNAGPIKMSKMTGASLLPVFVLYDRPFARLIIEKPLNVKDREDGDILQEYADILSKYIENHSHHFGAYLYETVKCSHWDDHPLFIK